MSCNGCRVLRKGCSENCVLRSCLQWIESPEAQGHATVFVAKFFGRAALMSFVSAVAQDQRPALFQSLLYEAAGRTVNPVGGAVGLVSAGDWHVCQAAVEAVLRGGALKPIPEKEADPSKKRRRFMADRGQHHPTAGSNDISRLADLDLSLTPRGGKKSTTESPLVIEKRRLGSPSTNNSEESVTTTCGGYQCQQQQQQSDEIKLLNLFN